jgi:RNA polymerase sigma-70 factor (ECF subfamily)
MPAATATKNTARTPPTPVPVNDPEVQLMLRVQRDEAGAFAEVVAAYWPRIFGRFFRALHDRQEAEDLAQEVFLRLYRSRRRYQPRARFTTWLYHISQNVVRNALRARRRHERLKLGVLLSAGEEVPAVRPRGATADEPSRPLERSELADVVRRAVADLAGRQRVALELHQFEDHSYAQVADALAMTPKAAKSLLYRARNQLRANLLKVLD